VVLWKKQPVDAVFEAVGSSRGRGGSAHGSAGEVDFRRIRHFGTDHAREVLRWAARYRSRGVVAFGIGGDEAGGRQDFFRISFARRATWGFTVCARREACGPESIRDAVELLGAERIGHGLTAIRDPGVMALLRERRIPVEVCPAATCPRD